MVIQRPSDLCYEKYYQREITKNESTSYPMLYKERYKDMWNSFYENIPELYKDCKKLKWILSEQFDKIGEQIDIKNIFGGKLKQ